RSDAFPADPSSVSAAFPSRSLGDCCGHWAPALASDPRGRGARSSTVSPYLGENPPPPRGGFVGCGSRYSVVEVRRAALVSTTIISGGNSLSTLLEEFLPGIFHRHERTPTRLMSIAAGSSNTREA